MTAFGFNGAAKAGGGRQLSLHLWLLIGLCWTLPAWAESATVLITEPRAGIAVFGEVQFSVDVLTEADNPATAVEFFVDDQFVERLSKPPWTVIHDVGESTGGHQFEAVATLADGETVSATLMSRETRVDLSVESALQQLYVTVERQGRRVLDLTKKDFQVLDQGEAQTLVTLEGGDVPLTALIMVDASQSMSGKPLRAALAGAGAFVDQMRRLDQAQVMLFSDRILHQTPFTSFPDVLTAGLSGIEARGGTSVDDHLYVGLDRLRGVEGRRVLILLSDGVDVSSLLRMTDVERAARWSQALIYWIRPRGNSRAFHTAWRSAKEHEEELELLARLVKRSGGKIVEMASQDDAVPAFKKIMEELRQQYAIGYYPTVDQGDGAWHEVDVNVRGAGLTVRAREGYIDQ